MIKIFFLLLTAFLYSLPASALALGVTFKASTEISSDVITLGDAVVFDLESPLSNALAVQRIGHAPDAGKTITLDSNSVIRSLHLTPSQNKEIQWNGSPAILVKRTGITIGPAEIESSIAAYIDSQKANLPEAEYSFVPYDIPLPFDIPTGRLDLEIISAKPGIIGTKRFSLVYKVDDNIVKNISIRGNLQAMSPVAVLTQNVKRGDILHPDMVRLESKDLSSLRTPCTDLRQVLGKRLVRSLRSGNVLDLSSIDFPPLIQKGQLVKILLNHNELHLTATGISIMNGKQDQVIRVKNTGSQKIIFCKVVAPGLVEVKI